jgi:hypothetical protein
VLRFSGNLVVWSNEVYIPGIRNCLIVCCLCAPSVIAQNTNPPDPALPNQAVSLDSEIDRSPGLIASRTYFDVPALTVRDDQADGNGNGNGNGSGNGSSSGGTAGTGRGSNSPSTAATTYVFPSKDKMNRYWLRNTIGPKAYVGAAFTASWNTWVHESPDEWHRSFSGWSKRFGSSLLDNGINTSTLVLWSRAMDQDPIYYRCDCSGTGPRTRHAIKMVYMARNRSGDLVFSPAKLGSPFAGPMVTRNTIYPDSFGVSDALRGGVYYLAGSVAWNIVREFIWKHPFM